MKHREKLELVRDNTLWRLKVEMVEGTEWGTDYTTVDTPVGLVLIREEDYDEAVSKIPHFHPHICRKFFSTIVSNNCGDIRVCALLEGHSDGLPNDKSYIKKSVKDR